LPSLEYVDDEGIPWAVRELSGERILNARGPRCLVFSTYMIARVVWRYPAEWAYLSASELVQLSWQT
jgi:hypothetical protein